MSPQTRRGWAAAALLASILAVDVAGRRSFRWPTPLDEEQLLWAIFFWQSPMLAQATLMSLWCAFSSRGKWLRLAVWAATVGFVSSLVFGLDFGDETFALVALQCGVVTGGGLALRQWGWHVVPDRPQPRLRRLQYSLGGLLGAMALICAVLAASRWVAWDFQRGERWQWWSFVLRHGTSYGLLGLGAIALLLPRHVWPAIIALPTAAFALACGLTLGDLPATTLYPGTVLYNLATTLVPLLLVMAVVLGFRLAGYRLLKQAPVTSASTAGPESPAPP